MGIEKFFSTLYQNFNIIKNLDLNNNNKYLSGKILLLDFNSIIHNVSSNILTELNNNDIINNLSINEIEYRIIENINKFIICGQYDTARRVNGAKEMFKLASEPKTFIEIINGTHNFEYEECFNDLKLQVNKILLEQINRFL